MHDGLLQRSVRFAADLERHGDRPAVVCGDVALTYADLARRADEAAPTGPRRVVVVPPRNDVGTVVAYLGALRAGHVVLLADHAVAERYAGVDDVHPDLALLLSTSGSTGSPKLVRLSHENLDANAASVAASLGLAPDDVGGLSLPLGYCYGLSILHSHLAVGASVALLPGSVLDRPFWEAFAGAGVTTLAGVPHTFELLDRVGFDRMVLPTLRRVTQAGGRLDPEQVRRWARLGRRDGWSFVVMYGQTEATARMAYLPPDLADAHPSAVGVPVPGGSIDLAPDGEVVYRGPNVMLGYAESAADLALGRTVDELRTGDLGRWNDAGLLEIVGRRSRFVKPFGLRVDLDELERTFGVTCTGDDRGLVVAGDDAVAAAVAAHAGLPTWAVTAAPDAPRLPNGKPDHAALLRSGRGSAPSMASSRAQNAVGVLYAEVLGVDRVGAADTFVSLGGDSLSYVELSIRLEGLLGTLPASWHTTPVGELVPAPPRPRLVARVETNVVLRAVAIVLVVGSHTDLFEVPGGAHVLLAVVGFNFARFQLRSGRPLASIGRIVVPSALWLGAVVAVTDTFAPLNVVLLNNLLGPDPGRGLWGYWFIEAVVQLLLVLAAVGSIPAVRRFERMHAWPAALVVAAVGLALRFDLVAVGDAPRPTYMPHNVLWLFAVGWLAERATTRAQRLVVSAAGVLGTAGFFGDPEREALVAAGILLLVWVPTLAVPTALTAVVGAVAGASLFTYLTHWQVQVPLQQRWGPGVALAGSLVAGVVAWRAWTYGSSRLWRRASTTSGPAPTSAA